MLESLDKFFLVFHTLFTIFNITGWIWKKMRAVHLATMTLTAFSWFLLGIRYGWGYCLCTDWHWQVREAMSRPIRSYSYIHFLILELTGVSLDQHLVDVATVAVFASCFTMSIVFNAKDYLRRRASRKAR